MKKQSDDFRLVPFEKKIIKPWGWEIVFTPPNLPYTGKILFVKTNQRLSLQYHDQKQETLCLIKGEGILWLEDKNKKLIQLSMKEKTGYTISQGQKHRFQANKDSLLVEASTPQIGKTYRIEDDYSRKDEELKNY